MSRVGQRRLSVPLGHPARVPRLQPRPRPSRPGVSDRVSRSVAAASRSPTISLGMSAGSAATSIAADRRLLGLSVSTRKLPWWSGRSGAQRARPWRSRPELTGLWVVANKAVVLGQLRNPGGCLVTLAVHQREIEKGTGRFPHQGPGRPRAVFSRIGVDLRIPIEQRTDVCRNLRVGGSGSLRMWRACNCRYSSSPAASSADRSPSQMARS